MPRASLLTFYIFFSMVALASSQTLAPKPLPKEPLEKYDNPPPLSPAVATSPRWISPGVLQRNVFRSDPVLNSDGAGHFFYLSLLQNFFDDLWRSLNGGQSWTNIAGADGGDKEWFVIDNTNSTGHGFQYQAWSSDGNNYGGRQFS